MRYEYRSIFGMCIEELVPELNQLSAEGWRVVPVYYVDEDYVEIVLERPLGEGGENSNG